LIPRGTHIGREGERCPRTRAEGGGRGGALHESSRSGFNTPTTLGKKWEGRDPNNSSDGKESKSLKLLDQKGRSSGWENLEQGLKTSESGSYVAGERRDTKKCAAEGSRKSPNRKSFFWRKVATREGEENQSLADIREQERKRRICEGESGRQGRGGREYAQR